MSRYVFFATICCGSVALAEVAAKGGLMTTFVDRGGAYVMHVFNSPGSLAVTHGGTIEYLVVAGGGSGSLGAWETAGGGAGGVQTGIITLDAGAYVIAVGIGGSGCRNGGDSSIDGLVTAIGGGYGGGTTCGPPSSGGSGGGGHHSEGSLGALGTPGQGFAGGEGRDISGRSSEGGGGGASSVGSNGQAYARVPGGAGLTSTITGVPVTYAVGGRGGTRSQPGNGADGARGTGNGGDGCGMGQNGFVGGVGGSGIVIIRYPITLEPDAGTSGSNPDPDGGADAEDERQGRRRFSVGCGCASGFDFASPLVLMLLRGARHARRQRRFAA